MAINLLAASLARDKGRNRPSKHVSDLVVLDDVLHGPAPFAVGTLTLLPVPRSTSRPTADRTQAGKTTLLAVSRPTFLPGLVRRLGRLTPTGGGMARPLRGGLRLSRGRIWLHAEHSAFPPSVVGTVTEISAYRPVAAVVSSVSARRRRESSCPSCGWPFRTRTRLRAVDLDQSMGPPDAPAASVAQCVLLVYGGAPSHVRSRSTRDRAGVDRDMAEKHPVEGAEEVPSSNTKTSPFIEAAYKAVPEAGAAGRWYSPIYRAVWWLQTSRRRNFLPRLSKEC